MTPRQQFPAKAFRVPTDILYVEDTMADRPDDSRRENRGNDMRSIASRTPRKPLTPERTAEIRLRILERAYDSPQIAATIARRLLTQGDL